MYVMTCQIEWQYVCMVGWLAVCMDVSEYMSDKHDMYCMAGVYDMAGLTVSAGLAANLPADLSACMSVRMLMCVCLACCARVGMPVGLTEYVRLSR